MAALPDDAFEARLESLKKAKLKRLIDQAVLMQFLKQHGISVSDAQIDKGVAEFKQMVMTPGCSCCGGGYENLEQFMKTNGYTMVELRQRVSGDIGVRLCVNRLAEKMTTPQGLAEAIKTHRAQIESDFVKGAIISFGFYGGPDYLRDAKAVEAKKEKLADEAWQRLQKGAPFAKVAKEMSEDMASAPNGGQFGCVHADYYGRTVEETWPKLEPGTYSRPIKTNWGYCIITREKLTEDDILSALKKQVRTLAEEKFLQEYKATRERAEIQYGSRSASAPATCCPPLL